MVGKVMKDERCLFLNAGGNESSWKVWSATRHLGKFSRQQIPGTRRQFNGHRGDTMVKRGHTTVTTKQI